MIPVFIASNTGYSGKTLVALGLAMKLRAMGRTVGYFKPVGTSPVKAGRAMVDADAVFMKEALALPEPLETISPFILDYEARSRLFAGEEQDAPRRIAAAFKAFKKYDVVIIGGTGNLFEGALLGVSFAPLLTALDVRALMVESWQGELTADTLFGVRKLAGARFAGAVINRVPPTAVGHVNDVVKPFLEQSGVRVFGVLPKDKYLGAVSVRHLVELLNGSVLCCEEKLEEFVENFSIGAMDVDSALSYFRRTPNKAVITGAHRSDIQLAALETSTRCIILTGGLSTNDVVIGKAQSKGVPIISVADDTFSAIDKIESAMGKTRIREQGKIDRACEIMDQGFDFPRFIKTLKI